MKKTRTNHHTKVGRRELLQLLGLAGATAPFVGALPPLWPLLNPTAQAAGATPRRFLQIFLGGGWDSILATDPCVGTKAGAGYQAVYHNNGTAVAGKSNLVVGPGLVPAMSAFAQAPTAFVNGIFVEVTAHELAVNYLYSGRLSLSRSREYPAIVATMGAKAGGFPAHVVLGGAIPLGDTAKLSPPLQSPSTGTFARMLAGPYERDENGEGTDPRTIAAGHELIEALDANFQKRLGKNGKDSLATWNTARGGLASLYAKDFGNKLKFSDQMRTDFGLSADEDYSLESQMAMAVNVLKEGVSRFVTANFGGFDTHQNHMGEHLPMLQRVATALNVLIGYLASTNDPDSPSMKLLETTTVLVSSEFVRTPLFNGANGTDHWQSGSVIMLGNKVQDNTVVGSTNNQGEAEHYNGAALLPDHLAASILRALGFASEAGIVSGVHLSDLFT